MRVGRVARIMFCHAALKVKTLYWKFTVKRITNIELFEAKIFSQFGVDGILAGIFSKIGTTNKFFVEFGVWDGNECNTRYLSEFCGWKGLMMDSVKQKKPNIKQEFITAENINQLFHKYRVNFEFDLLSIDIDGNDYWVWKALDNRYRPRVVIIEYNAKYGPDESVAISYDPNFKWDYTDYCGASLLAFVGLASVKGYTLVGCDSKGNDAIFVNNIDTKKYFYPQSIEKLYRSPTYGSPKYNYFYPRSDKAMVRV
ncbi:MAG: hypothetical protein WCI77_00865 [Candidatus Omnitrophota bacterium]